MNLSPGDAGLEADRFDGFGPNIYLIIVAEWKDIVGEESGVDLANLDIQERYDT